MCQSCAAKNRGINGGNNTMDTYTCLDCGSQRTDYICNFSKPKEQYRCHDCACKHMAKDPIWLENTTEANRKMVQTPEWKEANKKAIAKIMSAPDYEEKCKERGKVLSSNPVWIKSHNEAMKKRSNDPKWQEWRRETNKKLPSNPKWIKGREELYNNVEYIEKMSKMAKERFEDPIFKDKFMQSINERSDNIEWQNMMSERNKKMSRDPEWQKWRIEENKRMAQDPYWVEKHLIASNGEGIWYGNKALRNANNNSRAYYCERWNQDLWDRIDAAYDYKSILSGKTRFDNKNYRALTRHHLYWQPQACCIWDEDVNGYYAWIINNGERVKYYIKGDPNKFVLLTDKEHGIIRGKNGTTEDRIYWIKHIEDLVEQRAKEGKKCYLSPEEYEIYKVEHADIIAKYKK